MSLTTTAPPSTATSATELSLARLEVRRRPDGDSGPARPAPASATDRSSRSAARSSPWSATAVTSIPVDVWRTWYSSTSGDRTHDRPDHQRVDGHLAVAEALVGAAVNPGAQEAVLRRGRLLHEGVGELVADERLDPVAQVRDEDRLPTAYRWDRAVLLVDQLDDASVLGEGDDVVVRGAGADQPFGGAEAVDQRRPETGGDRRAELGVQVSLVLVTIIGEIRRRPAVRSAGEPGQHRRVAVERGRLQGVELLDDVGQRVA